MSNWSHVLSEVSPNKDDIIKKYILRFSKYRKRNTVVYFSNWLNCSVDNQKISIDDSDITGFMNAFCGLNKSKGLDLIIHTPGGSPTAAEGISKYIHQMFGNDIAIFVPHMCMSAGTLLACSFPVIYMGRESFLGPVDPQFNSIPAFDIKNEIEEAKKDLVKDPKTEPYWRIQLQKYPAAFYGMVSDAINLSSELLKEWLDKFMFSDAESKELKTRTINGIITCLNNNSRSHARHFSIDDCKNMGLKVMAIEDDQTLQDNLLSIYHACTVVAGSQISKMIVNSRPSGGTYVVR